MLISVKTFEYLYVDYSYLNVYSYFVFVCIK